MNIRIEDVRHELSEVYLFLNEHAQQARQCLPPPMLEIFAICEDDGEIVACCGASVASKGRLHIEKIYRLDVETAQFLDKERQRFCEIGRWFSVVPDAATATLKALVMHLEKQGVAFALCELKDATVRRAKRMGLAFHQTASTLNLEAIDATEIAYYQDDHPPKLYWLNFAEIQWK